MEVGYWKTQLKYALITTIIVFFAGGISNILFRNLFPEAISFSGFMCTGIFAMGLFWTGALISRYLIHWGIVRNPK